MTAPDGARLASPTLRAWIADHGALSPQSALVVGLHACAQASRLDDDALRSGLASLDAGQVRRDPEGQWRWSPLPLGSGSRKATDAEVVEQVGALLFECLTAERAPRTADRAATVAHLRTLRPDLPPAVVDLVARALSAGRDDDASLDRLAGAIRAGLGLTEASRPPWRRARTAIGVLAMVVLAVAGWRMAGTGGDARPGSHGLTAFETARYDARIEHADYDATIDEHTYAVRGLDDVDRLLTERLGTTDVRVQWNLARTAWVRRLSGDQLTAEQYLMSAPTLLGNALGPQHPYTRVGRLALADTLAARGEAATAGQWRAEAERFLVQLIPEAALRPTAPPTGVLWPVHTVAHVTPNAPELEGFRAQTRGGYMHPVTSTQRVFSERDGWMLHLRASGSCRASAVVGADPRAVLVSTRREPSGTWTAMVEGIAPVLTLTAPPGPSIAFTVVGAPDGGITARLADGTQRAALDPSAPPPPPPYAVAFNDPAACAVVWWEIAPQKR
jgi:hypothetical protein